MRYFVTKNIHRDFSCFQLHYLHYTIQTETSPCIHRIEFPIMNSALKDLIVYYSIRLINRTQVLFQNHKRHFLNIVNDLKMIFSLISAKVDAASHWTEMSSQGTLLTCMIGVVRNLCPFLSKSDCLPETDLNFLKCLQTLLGRNASVPSNLQFSFHSS